jgi:hypothetical protein
VDTVVQPSESRFFKYVWRFNALAIAGAAISVILLSGYAGFTLFSEATRTRRVTQVVNVGQQEKVSEEFSLGSAVAIAGTPYIRLPLYRGQSYPGSYYPKRSDQNIVNYLFLNTSTNESRWLVESAGQLIVESQILFNRVKSTPDEARTGVGVFYAVIDRDSNGDNRLSERDAVSLATGAIDGTNYRKLVENIEQLYSVQQIADDKVLVLYQKNQQTISELYSVPRMERLMQTNIPKVDLK